MRGKMPNIHEISEKIERGEKLTKAEKAHVRRWTEPVGFFSVDANGRYSGWPEPESIENEARMIRRGNEIEIQNGRMPHPNTEWAYAPGFRDPDEEP